MLKDANTANIHWYCNPCNKGTGRILAGVAALELRQSKLEQGMADLQKDVNEVKLCTGKIGGIKDDCTLLSNKISVVVSKFEDFEQSVDKKVESKFQELNMEQADRERRALNLVIFGLSESMEVDSKLRMEEDKAKVEAMTRILFDDDEFDFSTMGGYTRLGSKTENGKCRPLRYRVNNLDNQK